MTAYYGFENAIRLGLTICVAGVAVCCSKDTPPTPLEISVAKEISKLDSQSDSVKYSAEFPECGVLCDPEKPSYLCIFASATEDRSRQLNVLITRLSVNQPIRMSHSELLQIFDLHDPSFEKARGDTEVKGNKLTNSGRASIISTRATSGMNISFGVPENVKYEYAKVNASVWLTAPSVATGFSLHFGDPYLDQTHGGTVHAIEFGSQHIYFALAKTCVAYDIGQKLGLEKLLLLRNRATDSRMAAEQSIGSSLERITAIKVAYNKISPLSSGICKIEECPENCPVNYVPCVLQNGLKGCFPYNDCQPPHRICR